MRIVSKGLLSGCPLRADKVTILYQTACVLSTIPGAVFIKSRTAALPLQINRDHGNFPRDRLQRSRDSAIIESKDCLLEEKMVILIGGASHTGKTCLAQRLLCKYQYPYLSIDHLKMGLIRSGNTELTPMSDDAALTAYLWPIVREMVKTAVENGQNLIVEGCYIPFHWEADFDESYLRCIRSVCMVMSERYLRRHFAEIKAYAGVIEQRLDDSDYTLEAALRENARLLALCKKNNIRYLLIDDEYPAAPERAIPGMPAPPARYRWRASSAARGRRPHGAAAVGSPRSGPPRGRRHTGWAGRRRSTGRSPR